MPDFDIQLVEPLRFPLVNRFYKAAGDRSRAKGDDRVWVVRDGMDMVAALRLIPVAPEAWLLRSMCVEPVRRRQGIGLYLLKSIQNELDEKDTYCYPFSHLKYFYGQVGFVERSPAEVPEWIATPYERYCRQGRDIGLMLRQGR